MTVGYSFAASVGSEAPRNRLGAAGPVLTWVALYVAIQVLTGLGILLVPSAIGVVDAEGALGVVPFDVLGELMAGQSSSGVFPLGFLPPILFVTVSCLWRTVRSWRSGVSVA